MGSRLSPSSTRHRTQPPKVALLIETSNAYARGLLAGVEDYLLNHGVWNVYLGEQGRGDVPPAWLKDWNGDGVLARIENPDIAKAVAALNVPVVDLSSRRLLPDVPMVTTDNEAIARLAVQHFRERGFRHFAFCGDSRFAWSVSREQSFDQLLREEGFTCLHYTPDDDSARDSDAENDSIARWLGRLPLPVAIFACYDARGQQVLDACRRAGLSAPEEAAVLGVDNDEILCALSPPSLSSVIPNTRRTGWVAAELLASMMGGNKIPPETHLIPPVGIATRLSTDTLAVDDPQLARALRFIRENACEGIGVGDVLEHCPMARRSLEQRMKALLGRTPHEEILRVQLNRAKELLAATELTLPEIAARSGFRHAEYLSVVFKRETGMPPSEFRRVRGIRR